MTAKPEPFVLQPIDAVTLFEVGDADVGSGPPMHIHHEADETFYVLSGSYRMHIDGQDHHCPAGSLVFIPKGTPHGFITLEQGTRKLNLYVPSAFEGFFEELDEILPGATDKQLVALYARYATEIVGPIPSTYR